MTGRYGEAQKLPEDFTVRRRPFYIPLAFLFLASFAVIYITGVTSQQSAQGHAIFALTLVIVIGAISWFTIAFTRRQRDLVLLAEFQNALFAGAATIGARFNMIVRTDGSVIYIDPGLQNLFPEVDYRRLKHIDQFYKLSNLPQELQQQFNMSFAQRLNSRSQIELEMPDNTVRDLVLTVDPLPRPSGYYLLRGREYAERPKPEPIIVEKATNEIDPHIQNTQQLNRFITQSPVATASIDATGTVSHCNEGFLALTSHIKHRKGGWELSEVLTEEYRETFLIALENTFKNQASPEPFEVAIHGEEERSASVHLSLLQKPDVTQDAERTANSTADCLIQLVDLTEQKNLEMKYAHSQKMQAVGQLAGGVAHDFNNLLTAMIGFCDLLLMRHPAGDQSFADIMQIKQNANRAANLVRQLLAFSRRQTLQPKMLALTDVLAELSNLIRRLIGENIELKMMHGRDIGHVKADQGQLEQVLINLAVNARDAMKESGGALGIETKLVTITNKWDLDSNLVPPSEEDTIEAGDYVQVKMSDAGTGIPHDDIHKIFEPFYSTKEVGSGTGLGLATVYGIIKQTGGFVYVESEMGKGTSFYIFFPHYAVDPNAPAKQVVEAEPVGDLSGVGTVLLVEDEAPVRSFAARALRNKGYQVLEADCGEAALEIVAEHGDELNVIVSDVIMPGMNGPEMIKQITPQHPKVKVIFISGYAEDAFADSFGEDADFNFLPKPFTLKQLAQKIKDVSAS